jgi:hypothetical protein
VSHWSNNDGTTNTSIYYGALKEINMGLFDKIFGKSPTEVTINQVETKHDPEPVVNKPQVAKKPRKPKKPATVTKTAKEVATENNEPWVSIVSVDLDPANIGSGAFELDWNDKFVANLVRAGYKGKTDQQIVDQWFQDVCRNVVLENFEQEQADPEQRVSSVRKKIDGDRSEFS